MTKISPRSTSAIFIFVLLQRNETQKHPSLRRKYSASYVIKKSRMTYNISGDAQNIYIVFNEMQK